MSCTACVTPGQVWLWVLPLPRSVRLFVCPCVCVCASTPGLWLFVMLRIRWINIYILNAFLVHTLFWLPYLPPMWCFPFIHLRAGRGMHMCALPWRHNELNCVSNHQPHDCLLNFLLWHRSKKTSKLRVTGLCARNSPGTGEFPAQMASNAENVSIWWRYHGL